MSCDNIQDRQYYALGIAARCIGASFDAYRPNGQSGPLSEACRFLRLHAAFTPTQGGLTKAGQYGTAEWHGIFDASYTRAGDYLVGGNRTFFIAVQEPLLPVLCIRANRIVTIARPAPQTRAGINAYGGYTTTGSWLLASDWPVSILGISGSGESRTGLPTDQVTPSFNLLAPKIPSVVIAPGDIVSDDLGRNIVVSTAELSDLGWRVAARLAST